MKKTLFTLALLVFSVAVSAMAASPLEGHIVALDAGHGAGAVGATGYCGTTAVQEVDVNLAVRTLAKTKLETAGATVFEVPQLASRKDRVAAAEEAGAEVLISIHHNGSSDNTVDYTKSFITQGADKKLARPVHDALVTALGLPDKGIKHDGFGITVYGDIPGVLTESFFITNETEACDFLGSQERIELEAQAMYNGLEAYFSSSSDDGDGESGGGKECPPGKQKQNKC